MSNNSKIQTEIKQISYSTCQLDGHQTEPLSRICVDKQCKHKTIICSICEEQKHKGHETLPLKKFLQKFYAPEKEKKASDQQFNPLYYASKIQSIKSSFFSVINDFRTEINQILNNLETKGKLYFNNMSQKMLLLTQFQSPIQMLNKQGLSQNKLKKYFEQILDHVKIKQKFYLPEKLSVLLQQGQQKQKQLSTNLTKIKSEVTSFAQKMDKMLDVSSFNSLEKINLKWSEELKGAKIKISGTIAEQTGMQSSGQRFIMLEPSLSQDYSNGKVCWGIRIIKFVGWVGIGICLKNIIMKANYFFNYSTIGHGSYMISNNGYSWSHSATQFNSAHKTFHYAQNDIIYVEYDKNAKKLRFRKNQSAQKFELDIVDAPPGDSYHPCVNICSTGDSVQIINQGIPLS